MSRRHLATAVRDVLRAQWVAWNYAPDAAAAALAVERVGPDGRPPPMAGEWFVGVSPAGGRNAGPRGQLLVVEHDVEVTLSWRVRTAGSRVDDVIYADGGFWDRVDRVIAFLAKDSYDHHVARTANTLLGDPGDGNEPTGYRAPLDYADDVVEEAPPDWWHSGQPATRAHAGWVCRMRFSGARRHRNRANIPGVD